MIHEGEILKLKQMMRLFKLIENHVEEILKLKQMMRFYQKES